MYGEVQGVSFRWYARREAHSLDLSGWVRNRPDGSVEAVAEGEDLAVESFIDWMHHGPSAAHVDRVELADEEPEGSDGGFSIRA